MIFVAKFLWLIIRYRLFSTTSDNVLSWEGAVLIANMMAEYDIDFSAILWHEIHDRAFVEIINFPFRYLIQRLCEHVGVLAIPRVDERV